MTNPTTAEADPVALQGERETMNDDIWDMRREKLEAAIKAAVLDLFQHTGSDALRLDLDPSHGKLLVIAGPSDRLGSFLK